MGPKDEKKKMKPGVVLFSTVVSAYCAVGDMRSARRVVDEMRAAPKSWRAAPNDRTFAHLAWGYGQIGDVAGVTATAGLMAEAGVSLRPNSEARNALVRACRECGLPAAHVDRMVENLGDAAPARGARASAGSGARRRAPRRRPEGAPRRTKRRRARGPGPTRRRRESRHGRRRRRRRGAATPTAAATRGGCALASPGMSGFGPCASSRTSPRASPSVRAGSPRAERTSRRVPAAPP